MDIATMIGFVAAVAVVSAAVFLGGSPAMMINMPSILIVFGGTAGVVLMRFSLKQFIGAIKVGLLAVFHKLDKPEAMIQQVLELANSARKGGMLALEEVEVKDPFLKQGVQQLVDGIDPEIMETMLYKEIDQTEERHKLGQQIFKAVGDAAPALGMIGTLIGLVQMLSNLSDPNSLGPAMAVAMLTTLYGAALANLVALPIADKLSLRSTEEKTLRLLILDALLSIQQGHNPRIMADMLKVYLPGSKRQGDMEADTEKEAEAEAV